MGLDTTAGTRGLNTLQPLPVFHLLYFSEGDLVSQHPLKLLSFSRLCKKAKTARTGHVTQPDLLTINMTAGRGVCLRMWIMEKRGGHCPSLEATNRVLGKDREPYASASRIQTRNEKISRWTDLRPRGTPPPRTGLLFKATVLPLAALWGHLEEKSSVEFS